jgi:HAD superfamily hydrolase (TIGR01509 family)
MKEAVLFDLGNTLVHYYERSEFPAILEEAILAVRAHLRDRGLLRVSEEAMWQAVGQENHEAADARVRPLVGRLARIFLLNRQVALDVGQAMERCFTGPIFARAQRYPDSLPLLRELRARGLKAAVISNTPWGSPGDLWREELQRLGLADWLDTAVFCTDVGWRKPARPLFVAALAKLDAEVGDCLFVGDDPRWDLAGAEAMGIDTVLINRARAGPADPEIDPAGQQQTIRTLDELWRFLEPRRGPAAANGRMDARHSTDRE